MAMQDVAKFTILLSENFKQIFADNKISIEDVLNSEGIDFSVEYAPSPFKDSGFNEKDIVQIILASSAALVSISYAISKIINTIYHKPYFVEYYESEVLKEGEQIIKDIEGKPIIISTKKHKLVEPEKELDKSAFEFKVSATDGIFMRFGENTN